MSTFFPIKMCFTCSLSLNFPLTSVTQGWSFPPSLFLKSWHSHMFCESKNSDALSVSFWSDESRLISLKIPTVMRSLLDPAAETASSQIGNHRHQHSAASAAPLFGEGKSQMDGRLQILRIEPPAIRILKRPGQTNRSKINSPDYWLSAAILCCRSIFYWITAQLIKLSSCFICVFPLESYKNPNYCKVLNLFPIPLN